MIAVRAIALVALAAGARVPICSAKAPAVPSPLGTLVEYIAVEAGMGTNLLSGLGSEHDDAELRRHLAEGIRAGRAELIESTYLQSLSGERARAQAIHELIYESEPDPGSPPQGFTFPLDGALPGVSVPLLPGGWLRTPTHLEMQPIGQSLEIDASAGEGFAQLNIGPWRTVLTGEMTYGKPPWQHARPKFHNWRTTTSVRPQFGRAKLVSAFPSDSRMVFFFTTVYGLPTIAPIEDEFEGVAEAQLQLEIVEVDALLAQRLLEHETLPGGERGLALRDRIDRALAAEKAVTISSTLLRAKVGSRAKSQPVHEHKFPTEFDPAEVVGEGEAARIVPPTPTSFELRPLGTEVEVDVTALSRDRRSLLVNAAVQHVRLDREIGFTGAQPSAKVPVFDSLELNSDLLLRTGREQIVAVLTPRESPSARPRSGRRVLLLLRAEISTPDD